MKIFRMRKRNAHEKNSSNLNRQKKEIKGVFCGNAADFI